MLRKYWSIFIFIIFFAFIPRVWHFDNRVFIYGDSARDVLVARAANAQNHFPLFASFSSAGPFVFGPHYYWLIMAVDKLMPDVFPAFYYFLIFQSLIFVAVMMLIGKLLVGDRLSLLLGLIIAASPRQIIRSMGMSQHAIVGICAALSLLFLILFIKNNKFRHLFLSGFWAGTAIMMHYQAVALGTFAIAPLIFGKTLRQKVIGAILFIAGIITTGLPFLYWDARQNFTNFNNFLDYFLIGQYRIYVPNRWLWHFFDFWPKTFADLFGNQHFIGLIACYGGMLVVAINFFLKKISKTFMLIFTLFIIYFFYLRFYRGEKFEGYLFYLHPFIFLIISYFFYFFCKAKSIFFGVMIIIFYINFKYLAPNVQGTKIPQTAYYENVENNLKKNLSPLSKIAVFDMADSLNQTETWDVSDSLDFYLETHGLAAENGTPLVFCKSYCPKENSGSVRVINGFLGDPARQAYLLTKTEAKNYHLVRRFSSDVKREILEWDKTRPLKSTFNLSKFILERIPYINKLI